MTIPTPQEARDFFSDGDPQVGLNRAWFNLMRLHRNLYPKIAKTLRAHGINDPIWYEILLEIDRGGPGGRLMGQIEAQLYLPQYALSRHVGRLEKAGYIRREFIADGRRKQLLFLTPEGKRKHYELWPVYHGAMQDVLGPLTSVDEAYVLSRLLVGMLANAE
ncbi:MarR family winged helix-turn-helix transcriptional regulator [Aliiroseovarius sp.]|uniref:MarR family winged helix-turn-helix transcriptional regulator n=1 Tax=Aliiroseovarius sp. TaxID=1872442 RepID=UPI003BAD50B9